MTRPTYVYRLDVDYPEGTEPGSGWEPPGYVREVMAVPPDDYEERPFQWPAARRYLDQTAAKARADLLRSFGAKVRVVRSNPVTWPDDDEAAGDTLLSFVARLADDHRVDVVVFPADRVDRVTVSVRWRQRGEAMGADGSGMGRALRKAARLAAKKAGRRAPRDARWSAAGTVQAGLAAVQRRAS